MSEQVASSMFPNLINGSHIDYGRALVDSLLIDASRKPYVVARIAVAQLGRPEFPDTARRALYELGTAQEDGVLQPPLSLPLENEINAYREASSSLRDLGSANFAAFVLLNMAIDEGVVR